MKKYLILSFTILLLSISLQAQTTLINNDSLSIDEYYEFGIPSLNRMWSAKDYTKSGEVLDELKKISINALPRKKGVKSSLLFEKLTNTDKYDFLNKDYYDFNMRFTSVLETMQFSQKLTMLYITNSPMVDKKLKFSNEITAASITMLFLMEQEMDLLNTFLKDNPNLSEIQKNGLKKVQYGLSTTVGGMLQTIEKEYMYYERDDINSVFTYFIPFYSRINIFLDESSRLEFTKRLNIIAKKHEYEEIRKLANSIK